MEESVIVQLPPKIIKKGRPPIDPEKRKVKMNFSIEPDLAKIIMGKPLRERSKFVNILMRRGLKVRDSEFVV